MIETINFKPIVAAILALGLLQAWFIGFIFILKRAGDKRANLFFGLLLLVFSMALGNNLLTLLGIYHYYPKYQFAPLWLTLSLGTLLFYFVKFTLFPHYQFRKSDAKHFIYRFGKRVFMFICFSNLSNLKKRY